VPWVYIQEEVNRIGSKSKSVIRDVIAVLSDPNAEVREAAADVLGSIGPSANSAKAALRKAQNDSSEDVRKAAAKALKSIERSK